MVGAVGPGGLQGLFLFCLNVTGSSLVYGTFLGGGDIGFPALITALAVDSQGDCYVAGVATINVPTTPNALQIANSNANLSPDLGNGFILEVDSAGSHLLYGTWFGPRYHTTTITSIALDPNGSLYFAGATNATTFQVTAGAYSSTPGGGFIANLAPGSTTLSAFSYLASSPMTTCGGGGSQACQSGAMIISSPPQNAYVFLGTGFAGAADELVELSVPGLGATSPAPPFTVGPLSGFYAGNIALASSTSIWLVGGCISCSMSNLISSDAFQTVPTGNGAAVLIQLTDISPSVSFLGSAATGTSPYAAGQLVSIYGSQLGPSAGSGLQLGPGGVVTTSNSGTQVLFDSTAAPILYTGAGQVNTVIPCSVAGHASTQMVVEYMGAQSAPLTIPLSTAAPGIFTADGSGRGQAAVINQDNSLNSPSNPAPRGSVVAFYATGVGPTSPCVDGQIYQSNFPTLTLPMIVGVGSSGAQVQYAGQAPDLVSGVAQLNAVIPSDVGPGVVPLTLVVGGIFSTPGVTIAVK
jgi:uncharacterized protein (TIGR03437 family)